jgi:hypothetical protein
VRTNSKLSYSYSDEALTGLGGKVELCICGLLMFSFCYEMPFIFITAYDRLNPRLFDVVVVIALFLVRWRLMLSNEIIKSWFMLVLSFLAAATVSYLILLPAEFRNFAIFYAFKYVECLLALCIFSSYGSNDNRIIYLIKCFMYGLIMAGIVGILQYSGFLEIARYLPTGEQIATQDNIVLSTFGITYFHSGTMGAIGAVISLALYRDKKINTAVFMTSLFSGLFLAFFSGCRSALFMAIFMITMYLIDNMKYIFILLVLSITVYFATPAAEYLSNNSTTMQRMDVEGESDIKTRMGIDYYEVARDYWSQHGLSLYVFGGGFYAVPMDGQYRVGYGIHNIHLFPLEQAGLPGFLAANYFWFIVLRSAIRKRKNSYGRCALSIASGLFLFGWFGQIFYFGFGTENMVVFQVTILVLLMSIGGTGASLRPPVSG